MGVLAAISFSVMKLHNNWLDIAVVYYYKHRVNNVHGPSRPWHKLLYEAVESRRCCIWQIRWGVSRPDLEISLR